MRGAAGRVLERGAELLRRHAVEIQPRAVGIADRHRVAARADGILHVLAACDLGRHLGRRARTRRHDVDVAHHRTAPPDGAGDLGPGDAGYREDLRAQPLRLRERVRVQHEVTRLAQIRDAPRDLRGRFRAEARQRREAPVARGGLEILQRVDAQSLVDRADLGGAEPRHAEHLEQTFGRVLLELREERGIAARREFRDHGERRRPYAAYAGEGAARNRLGEFAVAHVLQGARRGAVGAALEAALPFEFEQVGDLFKDVRGGTGLHGGRIPQLRTTGNRLPGTGVA